MPSTALKSVVRSFHNPPAAPTGPGLLAFCLMPAAVKPSANHAWPPRKHAIVNLRQFASVESPNAPHMRERFQIRDGGIQYLLSSPGQRRPEAWEALLDRYLPHTLRMQGKETVSNLETDEPLPIEGVALILASAREAAKIDLLSYLGIFRERWEAVFWLVTTMLEGCPPYSVLEQKAEKIPGTLWDTHSWTLEEITQGSIKPKAVEPSNHVSMDEYLGGSVPGTGRTAVSKHRQVLGQIWQGLGCMILQAQDRSANNPIREEIMSNVLQILAHMHHSGTLSDSIYNYKTTRDKPGTQRPPTLYLLSGRIMTVLSDVAWKSHWIGEMEKAKSYGYELPQPRVQPQLPRVGAEVWLELVLWASIEGGWVTEAAWLVAEIERRRPNPELQWSVISWDEICSAKKPELRWTALLKLEIDRSRLNQATGIGIASRGTPIGVQMGIRTISREVILAIMDGLVNTASTDNHLYGNTVKQVRQYLVTCKSLLERGRPDLDPGLLNAFILRSIESSAIDLRREPHSLNLLLAIAPKSDRPRDSGPSGSLTSSNALDFSAAVLGLLHKTLDVSARQAKVSESLTALRSIQDIIDANRETYIQEFADKLREGLVRGSENMGVATNHEKRNAPMLYPEIPPYTVEAVLDLLVESKNFDLGKWLLLNEDIDGGLMSPNLYSETSLQPALLRFATATADDHLLMGVLETLQAPLSHSILHALLDCQVVLNKWSAVEGILKHFRDTEGMSWAILDAMRIAASIIALEWKEDQANGVQLLQARGILQDLVQGEFNSPRIQAHVPDLRELQRANQLGRIFQSVTGSLSTIDLGPQGYFGRGAYSISIPSEAFEILLASVVDYHGPSAGIRLWKQWCLAPTRSRPSRTTRKISMTDGGERVVQPTASMLRLILRPAIADLKNTIQLFKAVSETGKSGASHRDGFSESSNAIAPDKEETSPRESPLISKESLSIFDWGMEMYRSLGFSEHKILGEVPGSLRRLMKREFQNPRRVVQRFAAGANLDKCSY